MIRMFVPRLACLLVWACTVACAARAPQPAAAPPPAPAAAAKTPSRPPVPFVFVSGYRPEIAVFRLDPDSGRLEPRSTAPAGKDPSFLAVHPSGRFLFAVNEVDEGRVLAFSINQKTGELTRLNDQPSAGVGPAHLSVDGQGRFLLVANYAGKSPGVVAVLPIGSDGRLGLAVDTHDFGRGTMPHMITTDPDNRFVFVPCKGGPYVAQLRFDASKGDLHPNQPERVPAEGKAAPRHMDFHPSGRFAFMIDEGALTVTSYAFDRERGVLSAIESVPTIPADVTDRRGFSTADIHVHPNGRLLYGSNRGHNSLVIFRINPESGRLTLVGHEKRTIATPRNFHIDPSGTLLLAANQAAGNITVFRIDPESGLLEPLGFPTDAGSRPSYVGVVMLPGR
jgi:6-phosphogluconolactonase